MELLFFHFTGITPDRKFKLLINMEFVESVQEENEGTTYVTLKSGETFQVEENLEKISCKLN